MKRMPSPPWSVWPVVSGISEAVMPIRSVPWALATPGAISAADTDSDIDAAAISRWIFLICNSASARSCQVWQRSCSRSVPAAG